MLEKSYFVRLDKSSVSLAIKIKRNSNFSIKERERVTLVSDGCVCISSDVE
jgi:hypothetical protein